MPLLKRLPTLTQLRHLVAVADHRHFGRAAEACLVTQSSLSASIKELEGLFGRVIIERSRRKVLPTPLGEAVVARARAVLTEVGDIVDLVAASGAPLAGPLRLGVIPTIAPFLLPRALPAIRRAHPALELYLREDRSARLLEALAGGALDLLLLAFPYPTAAFETLIFADDPFWVALPDGHALAGRERLAPRDLAGYQLLLLEEGHCLRDHALGAGDPESPFARAEFQGSSLHTLAQMVDNGLGLTLIPKMALDAGIATGTRVIARPLDGAGREIGLVWRPTSPRGEDFARLAAHFRDELATPLPPPRATE